MAVQNMHLVATAHGVGEFLHHHERLRSFVMYPLLTHVMLDSFTQITYKSKEPIGQVLPSMTRQETMVVVLP
jgi:hypothetical protein